MPSPVRQRSKYVYQSKAQFVVDKHDKTNQKTVQGIEPTRIIVAVLLPQFNLLCNANDQAMEASTPFILFRCWYWSESPNKSCTMRLIVNPYLPLLLPQHLYVWAILGPCQGHGRAKPEPRMKNRMVVVVVVEGKTRLNVVKLMIQYCNGLACQNTPCKSLSLSFFLPSFLPSLFFTPRPIEQLA